MKKAIQRGMIALSAAGTLGLCAEKGNAASKPNVIVILADDLGYGDLSCYGATKISTPNIDRLATEGNKFINAYAPVSICSPSRYGLLAGRYVWRSSRHPLTGVMAVGAPLVFETNRLTLATLFKNRDYTTACIGKWHLGFGEGDNPRLFYDWNQEEIKPGPLEVGFDYFFGLVGNTANEPRVYIENHRFVGRKPGDQVSVVLGGTQIKPFVKEVKPWSPDAEFKNDQVATDLTKKVVEFIERSKDKPFFIYFTPTIAHNPITPSAAFIGTSGCGLYGDFVQELDSNVGTIVAALKKAGVLENTLILFTSDNGGIAIDKNSSEFMIKNYPANYQAAEAGHKICGDLRGKKHSIYEGGLRVPFIVRWPGQIPAGTESGAVLCLTDVFATFAAILGEDIPENAGEDSFNALSVWRGMTGASVRDNATLYSAIGNYAIRQGNWKLIQQGELDEKNKSHGENKNQLYNLADDPAETVNLWSSHPEVVKELSGLLEKIKTNGRSRPVGN